MTCAYWEFLVHGEIASPDSYHEGVSRLPNPLESGTLVDSFSVARVRPRTSSGITDLLLLFLVQLNAVSPSKKNETLQKQRTIYLVG